jgi:hypothetical protein
MAEHNAVIMSVLCLVIGVKLIGDAIRGAGRLGNSGGWSHPRRVTPGHPD